MHYIVNNAFATYGHNDDICTCIHVHDLAAATYINFYDYNSTLYVFTQLMQYDMAMDMWYMYVGSYKCCLYV